MTAHSPVYHPRQAHCPLAIFICLCEWKTSSQSLYLKVGKESLLGLWGFRWNAEALSKVSLSSHCRKRRQTEAECLQITPPPPCPPVSPFTKHWKSTTKNLKDFLSLLSYPQWKILSICLLLLKHQMQDTALHNASQLFFAGTLLNYCHNNIDYFAVNSGYCYL